MTERNGGFDRCGVKLPTVDNLPELAVVVVVRVSVTSTVGGATCEKRRQTCTHKRKMRSTMILGYSAGGSVMTQYGERALHPVRCATDAEQVNRAVQVQQAQQPSSLGQIVDVLAKT